MMSPCPTDEALGQGREAKTHGSPWQRTFQAFLSLHPINLTLIARWRYPLLEYEVVFPVFCGPGPEFTNCSPLPTRRDHHLKETFMPFWNSPRSPPFPLPLHLHPSLSPTRPLPLKKSGISSLQVSRNRTKCFTSALRVHGLA